MSPSTHTSTVVLARLRLPLLFLCLFAQSRAVTAATTSGVLHGGDSSSTAVTPVQKVTELLSKLRNQVQEEGMAEASTYDKYACFCKEQADSKVFVLKKSDMEIEHLQAIISSLDGEINQLALELVTLREDVGVEEGQAREALEMRQGEFATYQTERQNLTEGIDAIAKAVETLRNSRDAVAQARAAAVLAQVQALAGAQQEPQAYAYRSRDILATLVSLQATFKSQLARLDEEEAGYAHQHNMVEGARANKIAAMKASIVQKDKLSAQKTEEKSRNDGLLNDEATARQADQEFLDELTAGCTEKARAWDERSRIRAEEITKLTEAMAALEQLGSLYTVNRRLTGLVLKDKRAGKSAFAIKQDNHSKHSEKAPSFLQIFAPSLAGGARGGVPQRLLDFLERRARELGSQSLAQVLAVAQLPDDPFLRVRGLIKDLISHLESSATEESARKNNCDLEMKTAVDNRDAHKATMETLANSIEATTAEVKQIDAVIAELTQEIADLHKVLHQLTELRLEEQAANNKTVIEANEGKAAVDQAIQLLSTFYGGQVQEGPGKGTLLQLRRAPSTPANAGRYGNYTAPGADRYGNTVADLAPETFTEPYQGKYAESNGVLGLLEIISSDFDRTSTTTASAEAAAESAYEAQKTELENAITEKNTELGLQEARKTQLETGLVTDKDSLNTEKDLHNSTLTVLEALKASCIDEAESYEQRRQRRQAEIEALKEAHRILEEWQS